MIRFWRDGGRLFVLCVLCGTFVPVSSANSDEDVPAPEELLAILRAIREQFSSEVAESYIETYEGIDGEYKLHSQATEISRWRGNKAFVRREMEFGEMTGEDGTPIEAFSLVDMGANGENIAKRLKIGFGSSDAVIQGEPYTDVEQTFAPVRFALDAILRPLPQHFSTSAIARETERNTVIIEGTHGSSTLRLELDPGTGYMPTLYEQRGPNGEIGLQYIFSDYREVSPGLWLPFSGSRLRRIRRSQKQGMLLEKVTVREVRVNVPVPDEELEIVFPPGTDVDDRVSGVYYTIGEAEDFDDVALEIVPGETAQSLAARPAPDAVLQRAADQIRATAGSENLPGQSSLWELLRVYGLWGICMCGLCAVAFSIAKKRILSRRNPGK